MFSRKLVRKQKDHYNLSSPPNSDAAVNEMGPVVTARECESLVLLDSSSLFASTGNNIGGKKRSFDY